MPKKLKLNELNIDSFKTSENKIKGGTNTGPGWTEVPMPQPDPFFTIDALCQRISIGVFCFPERQK